MSYNLYNLDLKKDDQNYACFSGWLLSNQHITEGQKNSLIENVRSDNETLHIKSFDGEGESLDDYCSHFQYFDLELIGNKSVVILDLNYIQSFDDSVDRSEVFLCDDSNNILLFDRNGDVSFLEV